MIKLPVMYGSALNLKSVKAPQFSSAAQLDITSQPDEKDREITRLNAEVTTLKARLSRVDVQITQLERNIAQLEAENNRLRGGV